MGSGLVVQGMGILGLLASLMRKVSTSNSSEDVVTQVRDQVL